MQHWHDEAGVLKNPHPLAAHLLELFARRALSAPLLHDLVPGQWVILRRLGDSAGKGRTPRQLARALEVDVKSAGRCISALERKGLVIVDREGSSHRVRLTEAGRLQLLADPLGWIDGALFRLPPRDKHELCRMLTILLNAHAMDTPDASPELVRASSTPGRSHSPSGRSSR